MLQQTDKKNLLSTVGFTLIEIMVAIIIVSVLAALSLPNLKKILIDQSIERAKTNMRAIFAAEQTIYMNTGHFWPNYAAGGGNPCPADLAQIFTALEINFDSDNWTYQCSAPSGGRAFNCYAKKYFSELNLTVQVHIGSGSSQPTCISAGAGNGHRLCPKASLVTPSCI